MNVTEIGIKESRIHCSDSDCCQRNSAYDYMIDMFFDRQFVPYFLLIIFFDNPPDLLCQLIILDDMILKEDSTLQQGIYIFCLAKINLAAEQEVKIDLHDIINQILAERFTRVYFVIMPVTISD